MIGLPSSRQQQQDQKETRSRVILISNVSGPTEMLRKITDAKRVRYSVLGENSRRKVNMCEWLDCTEYVPDACGATEQD